MRQDPAEELVSERRQAETAGVGLVEEEVRPGLCIGQMIVHVRARAGLVGERLGHERRDRAARRAIWPAIIRKKTRRSAVVSASA